MTTITNTSSATSATESAVSSTASNASAEQDRFLKLLVAQLNNQDPLNPMDNAQMTSQIAQINTVTGIEKLNSTVENMVAQLTSSQLVQGSSMVGRAVLVEGNALTVTAANTDDENSTGGLGYGAFDLGGSAANVAVDITDANGKVIDTLELGSLAAGRHHFDWDASAITDPSGLKFNVRATNGEMAVASTPLSMDRVDAISIVNGSLQLELARAGATSQNSIKSIL